MTPDIETLTALLERVRLAKRADRELFEEIARRLLPQVDDKSGEDYRIAFFIRTGAWTDAALILVELLLPDEAKKASIIRQAVNGLAVVTVKTLPLTILTALFTGLLAQERTKGERG